MTALGQGIGFTDEIPVPGLFPSLWPLQWNHNNFNNIQFLSQYMPVT